jgi:polyphosphate kinase 2
VAGVDKHTGKKVVIIFEGRDAAGKGGTIKRITECLNPRTCKVVALPKPTEREESQWYFQRYLVHLPAAGEIVLFDRSWYNCAGVDKVMGFVTDKEYNYFLKACPQLENILIDSGIRLIKYWFSVSQEEQKKRFKERIKDRTKRWKISNIDIKAQMLWDEYSMAKDNMFEYTNTESSPWYSVDGDIKKHARINCISHLLNQFEYEEIRHPKIEIPEKKRDSSYIRPPIELQEFIPDVALEIHKDGFKK